VLTGLKAIPGQHPLLSVQLGPVVGSHTGPNTVGVCYIVPTGVSGPDD
jgi:fatty acid-binding protein DegV